MKIKTDFYGTKRNPKSSLVSIGVEFGKNCCGHWRIGFGLIFWFIKFTFETEYKGGEE